MAFLRSSIFSASGFLPALTTYFRVLPRLKFKSKSCMMSSADCPDLDW